MATQPLPRARSRWAWCPTPGELSWFAGRPAVVGAVPHGARHTVGAGTHLVEAWVVSTDTPWGGPTARCPSARRAAAGASRRRCERWFGRGVTVPTTPLVVTKPNTAGVVGGESGDRVPARQVPAQRDAILDDEPRCGQSAAMRDTHDGPRAVCDDDAVLRVEVAVNATEQSALGQRQPCQDRCATRVEERDGRDRESTRTDELGAQRDRDAVAPHERRGARPAGIDGRPAAHAGRARRRASIRRRQVAVHERRSGRPDVDVWRRRSRRGTSVCRGGYDGNRDRRRDGNNPGARGDQPSERGVATGPFQYGGCPGPGGRLARREAMTLGRFRRSMP